MYYIISLYHTKPSDSFLTLWRSNNAGYCFSKQMAGTYDTPKPGYHDSELNIPITAQQADKLFIKANWENELRDMIPNGPHVWNLLGVKPNRKRGYLVKINASPAAKGERK